MATDHYGNNINVGDVVTIVGYCDQFTITDVQYGGEMVKLAGNGGEQGPINVNDVIKVG